MAKRVSEQISRVIVASIAQVYSTHKGNMLINDHWHSNRIQNKSKETIEVRIKKTDVTKFLVMRPCDGSKYGVSQSINVFVQSIHIITHISLRNKEINCKRLRDTFQVCTYLLSRANPANWGAFHTIKYTFTPRSATLNAKFTNRALILAAVTLQSNSGRGKKVTL